MAWEPTPGSWPAFWLAPIQIFKASTSGEIDIFEGQGSDPAIFYATLHIWADNGKRQLFHQGCACRLSKDNNFAAWHKYGLLWTPGKMIWYYDDQAIYSLPTPSIFDAQDYFIMLGSQKGVSWTYGNLKGVTADSMRLKVDWVRVWQAPTQSNNRFPKWQVSPNQMGHAQESRHAQRE
jgi:beta-glucanase (GH16 family)